VNGLSVRDVSVTYPGDVQALKGVNLEVPTGMFGFLGPNGAGKSTLMRILATLQEPDRGSVHLGQIDVVRDKRSVRRQLGYLPQEFGLDPRWSAMAFLDHVAVLKGILDGPARSRAIEELLHRVNLWDVRKRRMGTFSGGMKQRIGIAQAMLGSPSLIIVDEPTAGLDPAERRRFHDLLSELSENIVVLLSTHIVDDVRDLCRAMAIIDRGEILLTGDPHAEVARLEGRVWQMAVPRSEVGVFHDRYNVISTRLYAGSTVAHVLADEQPGEGFMPSPASLEDVYFTVLKQQAP